MKHAWLWGVCRSDDRSPTPPETKAPIKGSKESQQNQCCYSKRLLFISSMPLYSKHEANTALSSGSCFFSYSYLFVKYGEIECGLKLMQQPLHKPVLNPFWATNVTSPITTTSCQQSSFRIFAGTQATPHRSFCSIC